MAISRMFQILISTLFYYSSSSVLAANNPTYNVLSYGAKPNGNSDCTTAFLSAWDAACATTTPATIYVPPGRYLLKNVEFNGKLCKNTAITIRIDGTLVAPFDYNAIGNSGQWLDFHRVTGVTIEGGTLDGQGSNLWACKDSGKDCPTGATSLALHNSNNVRVNGLASVNSQMFHIDVDECQSVNFANIKITAPENSPNTDGIHVEHSSGVTIVDSQIATGDDCVSIGPGTSNLLIQNVKCGPGHGISIGSLGWKLNEEGVENVTVASSMFTGTDNGVRVKTWARPSNGFVRNVHYQHLSMINVKNPILIDQHYCPNEKCPHQNSGVKISEVTYEDIKGTSATEVAVKLDCSETEPCNGISIKEVVLKYKGEEASSSCSNASGNMAGVNCIRDSKIY